MRRAALFSLLAALVASCSKLPPGDPPAARGAATGGIVTEAIDWGESVGIFIGIEDFHDSADAPPPVRYAADDATDLAWLFSKQQQSLLRPDRTLLLLSGRPDKPVSQERLLALKNDGIVVAEQLDAAAIYRYIGQYSAKVGRNGVLILSIATHGYTAAGAHILLTPEATMSRPHGVVLDRILQSIPPAHGSRVLLFVDACREPVAVAPSRQFEDLQFPGDYSIFAASGPGGYARPNERARNGMFTAAVLEGLNCGAATDNNGFITPGTLEAYVGRRVRDLTGRLQRPEARSGGLTTLPLIPCGPEPVAKIVSPQPNAMVSTSDTVDVVVNLGGFSATVVICAVSSGECWKQNRHPVPAAKDEVTPIGVQFGGADTFRVYVALSSDLAFLQGEEQFSTVPLDRKADGIVHWLKPVTVTLKEES